MEPRNPVSYDIAARALNLPSGFNMTEAIDWRVVEVVSNVVGARRVGAAVTEAVS